MNSTCVLWCLVVRVCELHPFKIAFAMALCCVMLCCVVLLLLLSLSWPSFCSLMCKCVRIFALSWSPRFVSYCIRFHFNGHLRRRSAFAAAVLQWLCYATGFLARAVCPFFALSIRANVFYTCTMQACVEELSAMLLFLLLLLLMPATDRHSYAILQCQRANYRANETVQAR